MGYVDPRDNYFIKTDSLYMFWGDAVNLDNIIIGGFMCNFELQSLYEARRICLGMQMQSFGRYVSFYIG